MLLPSPSAEQLQAEWPDVQDLCALADGGFKSVYSGTIGGQRAAIKVAHIPTHAGRMHQTLLERFRREYEALSLCHSPTPRPPGTMAASLGCG